MTWGARHKWVWVRSMRVSTCHGPKCGAPIVWVELCESGKKMPFNLPLSGRWRDLLLKTEMREVRPGSGSYAQAGQVDLVGNHFATCVDRKRFEQPRML